MSHGAYAPNKALWHSDSIDMLRRGEQPVPKHVQLIISDLCNQDCAGCPYRMEGYSSNQHFGALDKNGTFTNNPTRFIPYEKVLEILDDCAEMGVRAIQLTGGGEPTVHPRFKDIVRAVLDRGLELALVTNGVRLPEDVIEDLMRATWVRVSIDAGNMETYRSYRRCPEWHWRQMLSNLSALVARKKDTGSALTIGVGFVVARENHTEIIDLVLRARQMGVDNVRISAAFTTEGAAYHEGIFEEAKRQASRAVQLATPDFRVYDMLGDRVDDLEEGAPDYGFCGIQHFTTYIGGDQKAYRCCVTSYNDQGFLGDLKDQRLSTLWSSPEKRQRMQTFDARTCERCMFNQRNRAILSALTKPEHENFT